MDMSALTSPLVCLTLRIVVDSVYNVLQLLVPKSKGDASHIFLKVLRY